MVVTDKPGPGLSVLTDCAPQATRFYLMPNPYLSIGLFANYMPLDHTPEITPSEN
jgi:hypothetical protein